MSIRNKNGVWYYEFEVAGKCYRGTCRDSSGQPTKNERVALAYEKAQREMVGNIRSIKSTKALVENYREELTGSRAIPLREAYIRSLEKPRKRTPGEKCQALKAAHWQDFLSFMEDNYPEVTHLAAVARHHAENYVASLTTYGKYTIRMPGKRREAHPLSGATITDHITTITEVFTLLADDAGLVGNPFANIPKPSLQTETRQPFTLEELKTIRENLDDFTRPLFFIAISTALREGDICTLKWNEIDLANLVIRRGKMRKTRIGVDIPIMPPLADFFRMLQEKRTDNGDFSEYVLPYHAKMYLENRSGVSYRIKSFLEDKCHIVTTIKPPGRDRAVSVKDLHSCRHSFCYYAGLNGIPLNVVQGLVGHMTPEMTKLYSNHASLEDKRKNMQLMSDFILDFADGTLPQVTGDCSRDSEIIDLLKKIPYRYANEVKMLLEFLSSANPRAIIEFRQKLMG